MAAKETNKRVFRYLFKKLLISSIIMTNLMKFQDLLFILVFLFVFWRRNARLATIIGLLCLLLAIPLFKFWIFFTAERLTWYAASFFLYTVILLFINELKSHENRH